MIKNKKYSLYRPLILSRHPSHSILRSKYKQIQLLPFRSVIRLGSSTECADTIAKGGNRVEINTVQAVKNSASKLLMKQKFIDSNVETAKYVVIRNGTWCDYNPNYGENMFDTNYRYFEYDGNISENCPLEFPFVSKSLHGSRGVGNTKFNNLEELDAWLPGKNLNNYIFEKFIKMTREYRLHVTKFGCFYSCRKLVKNDAPEGSWQKHDDICNWILEENPSFKKPNNWNDIVADCIKAKDALGLDICAFDVGVQGSVNGIERENPKWNIFESCSAPSFGETTGRKYIEILPKLIIDKSNN